MSIEQINSELRDLCVEVVSLQERALHRVEAIENDFEWLELPEDVKTNFFMLQRLLERV